MIPQYRTSPLFVSSLVSSDVVRTRRKIYFSFGRTWWAPGMNYVNVLIVFNKCQLSLLFTGDFTLETQFYLSLQFGSYSIFVRPKKMHLICYVRLLLWKQVKPDFLRYLYSFYVLFLHFWVKLNNTVLLLFLVYIYLLSIADLQKRSLKLLVCIRPKNLRTSERVHKEEMKERNHSPPNIFPALWEDLMCLMNSNIMISDGSHSIIIWLSDIYKVEYIV